MAKKKKPEEPENLERWLVSYADFMTLLFATFVVLYALSQTDVSKYETLGNSISSAFSPIEGSPGVMENNGENALEGKSADAIMNNLLMEYINPKYEEKSYEEIKKDIEAMKKNGELDGVDVKIDDRGLVIILSEKAMLFKSGSAELSKAAKIKLDKVGATIGKKFILHLMRVEGHTDNLPTTTDKYPSNWELSSARSSSVTRYLIDRFKFNPELFTVVGFADTRPMAKNNSEANRDKNRRVEIIVLKNKYKGVEDARDSLIKMDKKSQEEARQKHLNTINSVLGLSDAAKQLTNDESEEKDVILLKNKK